MWGDPIPQSPPNGAMSLVIGNLWQGSQFGIQTFFTGKHVYISEQRKDILGFRVIFTVWAWLRKKIKFSERIILILQGREGWPPFQLITENSRKSANTGKTVTPSTPPPSLTYRWLRFSLKFGASKIKINHRIIIAWFTFGTVDY